MMNIAVVIPIHKREELARRVIGYYESLDVRGLRLFVVPVLSDLECNLWNELNPPKAFSLNEPLAAKFNKGIDACRMLDIDGVMIVGSDDLIAPWVFEGVAKKRPFYQEVRGVHFFNSKTGQLVFDHQFKCGAGKYFSKDFLDKSNWNPYDEWKDKNVDSGPERYLASGRTEIKQASMYKPACIDIKTDENMWDWEWVKRLPGIEGVESPGEVFAHMDDELVERWSGL